MGLPPGWLPDTWWPLLAVAAVLVVVAAFGGQRVGRRHGSSRGGRPEAAPPPAEPAPSGDAEPGTARPDGTHRALVVGLIGAHDLAGPNDAVRAHVEQVLRRAGVRPVHTEAGAVFDPEVQEAVATESLSAHPDPRPAPGTVAKVVRPGWQDDEVSYRATEVVVWTP